jgi:hypothetical protein
MARAEMEDIIRYAPSRGEAFPVFPAWQPARPPHAFRAAARLVKVSCCVDT